MPVRMNSVSDLLSGIIAACSGGLTTMHQSQLLLACQDTEWIVMHERLPLLYCCSPAAAASLLGLRYC